MLHWLQSRLGGSRWMRPPVAGERVCGPLKGYFIAVYAAPSGPRGYLAYYKICNGEPASYWDACCLVKGCGEDQAADLQQALASAEAQAREQIRNMPSLQRLAAWRERRTFYLFEWHALVAGRALPGWEVA
jgi:hypothetical protein